MTNCILAFIPLIKEIDTKIFSFFLVILKVVNFLWHTLYISAVTNIFCTACNLLQRHLQKYMYVQMVLTNWRESQYSYFCGFLYFGFLKFLVGPIPKFNNSNPHYYHSLLFIYSVFCFFYSISCFFFIIYCVYKVFVKLDSYLMYCPFGLCKIPF